MEEEDKLPLKRVELSLTKFNEVAIPHHLDLLRQHKANIIKYESCGEWGRVRSEQCHARRVAAQLRSLLGELAALRARLRSSDLPAFDAATTIARRKTQQAVVDYLGVIESSCVALAVAGREVRRAESTPVSISQRNQQVVSGSALSTDSVGVVGGSVVSTESVGVVGHHSGDSGAPDFGDELMQLQIDEQEVKLREREAVLRGWRELQTELTALHDAWTTIHATALAQQEQVRTVEEDVETVGDNVTSARDHLAVAERLHLGTVGVWGASGALAGATLGGPVGFILGAKIGAAAALAGSALGFIAARTVAGLRAKQLKAASDHSVNGDHSINGDHPDEEQKKDR